MRYSTAGDIYVVPGNEEEMLYCGTVLICNRQSYGDRSGNESLYQLRINV